MKYPFGNDPAKINDKKKFWNRDAVKRPLMGFSFKSWLPLYEYHASLISPTDMYLTPDMIRPEGLRNYASAQTVYWNEMAAALSVTVPVIIVFLLLQNYLAAGLTVNSVKG